VSESRFVIEGLRLVVSPGLTVRLEELPPYSIAVDGVVQGSVIDAEQGRFSFDHHGECVRLVTSATCRQVADALLLGVEPGEYTVYVNDVDADTVLAVALLAHPEWLAAGTPTVVPVRRLVEAAGGRDAHGPAYPVLEPDLLARFSEMVPLPSRRSGTNADEMAADLAQGVEGVARLVTVLAGKGSAERPETRNDDENQAEAGRGTASFSVTHTGAGWVMATSDADALDEGYARGFPRLVMWRRLEDGSIAYTVARRSDLVSGFPVGPASRPGTILAALASREPGWGGGSSIGGAPRHPDGSRSSLTPDDVFAIVERVVAGAR